MNGHVLPKHLQFHHTQFPYLLLNCKIFVFLFQSFQTAGFLILAELRFSCLLRYFLCSHLFRGTPVQNVYPTYKEYNTF
eukprot:snap_masked-scaffold_37-processed-gene-2.75-mRNA-1 protein AED:1.00 eAED:1.00 QI:0/0/0/0/1/1/2/0/78